MAELGRQYEKVQTNFVRRKTGTQRRHSDFRVSVAI